MSMFRNTVKIGVFENAKPDKQLLATEPVGYLSKGFFTEEDE